MDWLKDEQGKPSLSRRLLVAQLVFVNLAGIVEGATTTFAFPGPWWTLQAGLLIGLLAWAGGPRAMQYLGPQVGRVASAVSEAVKKAAGRKTPHHDEEDREWSGSAGRSS